MDKLIFLDIDGTLVGRMHRIPADAVRAVRAARSNGHRVVICTGRAKPEIEEHILAPGFDGLVAVSGAYVELGGTVRSETFMRPEVVTAATRMFDRLGVDYMWQSSRGLWATGGYLDRILAFKRFGVVRRLTGDDRKPDRWHDIDDVKARAAGEGRDVGSLIPASKGTFLVPNDLNLTVDGVREALGPDLTVINGSMGAFAKVNGEVMIPGVDKGSALRSVASMLGVEVRDTVAMGDSDNDLPMLEAAGVSVAMGNGTDSVKAVADFVTGDVDRGGLKDAFDRLGLL